MDTTHIAYTAEDLISHKLQRSGLLVAKPKFDREGADLLVLMAVKDGAKFCRVQCKGRSLINSASSNVEVPKIYVEGAFILCLFVDDGNIRETNLFCFFPNDIKKRWVLKTSDDPAKDFYLLTFSKTTFNDINKDGNLTEYALTNDKIEGIKDIIRLGNTTEELKKLVLDLLEKHDELSKLNEKRHKVMDAVKDLRHLAEIKRMTEEKIEILEEHYQLLENLSKQKGELTS